MSKCEYATFPLYTLKTVCWHFNTWLLVIMEYFYIGVLQPSVFSYFLQQLLIYSALICYKRFTVHVRLTLVAHNHPLVVGSEFVGNLSCHQFACQSQLIITCLSMWPSHVWSAVTCSDNFFHIDLIVSPSLHAPVYHEPSKEDLSSQSPLLLLLCDQHLIDLLLYNNFVI